MTIALMPNPVFQAFDSNGNPLSGGKLYFYEPGTSTPKTAYQESTGTTAHANPVILDADGKAEIWLSGSYKVNLTSSTDVQQSGYPVDYVSFMPDTALTQSEWLSNAHTFTYVSATQFTVPGDETAIYQVGRRVKCLVSAGTVYGVITVSAYTTLTTVTVSLDSGSLDSGLSDVDVGLISATYPSLPKIKYTILDGTAAAHATSVGQVQAGAMSYIADTGAADAYVATLSPAITAYTTGMEIKVKIANANLTTTPTLNVNGLGAKTIKRGNSAALLAGDLPVNHQATFRYNGTDMILQNPATLVDHDHSAAGKGAQITSSGATALLGTWDATKADNTVYQAATDLEIHVYLEAGASTSYGYSQGYTDANNPPTTIVIAGACHDSATIGAGMKYGGFKMSVKKGHYWKVVKTAVSGSVTQTIRIIPVGS